MEEIIEQEQTESPALEASLRGRAEEFFCGLWASLFHSGRVVGKSVMICSAARAEGATTVACGLALAGSMPPGEPKVALVDLDLRHGNLHKILRLERTLGVSEIVLEGMDPKIAAQNVKAGVDVYTAGNVGDRALEILRSDALGGFLNHLSGAYDRVLLDVAAVNTYPDAQVLASIIKDVVLVAHTEQTPREAVAQAKKRLEAGGGRIVGLVLNLRTYPIPRFLYRRV